MKQTAFFSLLTVVSLLITEVFGAPVGVGDLYASTTPGVYWSSMRTKTRPIALDWPGGATKAELVIQSLSQKGKQVISIPSGTESYSWTAFDGAAPENDELYTLTLSYLDGTDAVVGNVQTAEVAVLRASFAATDLPLDTASSKWRKASVAAIIPYDVGWFTNDQAGAVSTLTRTKTGTALVAEDALAGAGWFGWNFRRSGFGFSGTFGLALANGDAAETYAAELDVTVPGFLLLFR